MGKKRVELTKKQQNEKIKERVIAMYESGMSVPEIEKATGKPHSTIYRWINSYKVSDEGPQIEQKRAYRKEQLIEDAWDILSGSMSILKQRIGKAKQNEEAAAAIIKELMQDDEMSEVRRKVLISQLAELNFSNIRDITTVINTVYDKQAAASGESVTDNKIEIVINGWKDSWDD